MIFFSLFSHPLIYNRHDMDLPYGFIYYLFYFVLSLLFHLDNILLAILLDITNLIMMNKSINLILHGKNVTNKTLHHSIIVKYLIK